MHVVLYNYSINCRPIIKDVLTVSHLIKFKIAYIYNTESSL
jgi:hypothetical protein